MNVTRARAALRRSEGGFAIVEVVVSAAVLAMVAVAVLAGMDGASSSTGREKSRSIAASLAEQDQERMRSMQISTLATLAESRTVNVDGADFTVDSGGQWVSDATGGTPSCQQDSKQADYLKISSTVRSNVVGTRTKPVVIESLVAPSVVYSTTHGSLAVQVNDRNGVGVEGIAVTINGPTTAAADTNELGCAIFQYIPVGNYDITLNRVGWVDHYGNQTTVGNQDVAAGLLNIRTMFYDRAATIETTIKTYRPNDSTTVLPSAAKRVSATNGDAAGLQRVFSHPTANTRFSTLDLEQMFPFKNAYSVFTGGCQESNPVNYDAAFFNTSGAIKTDPGGTHAVDVFQPPLNIRVRSRTSTLTYINGARVIATLRTDPADTPACPEPTYEFLTMTNPYTATVGWPSQATPWVTPTTFDPGLPFGVYDLCLQYTSSGTTRRYRTSWDNDPYENDRRYGRSSTLTLPPAYDDWSSGSC
jgi:type II secretory pathway pseudopilin PulG